MKNNTTNVEETIDQAKESIESARAEKEKTEKAKTDNGKAENDRQENESIVNRTNEKDTQPLEENPLDVVNEIRKSMKSFYTWTGCGKRRRNLYETHEFCRGD